METYSKESGRKTKLMAMESIYMLTELSTKVSGKMTCSTVREKKPGQMEVNMMEST